MDNELKKSQKDKIWEIIQLETEGFEQKVDDLPEDLAFRFEQDKEVQYEKLVCRLQKEGVW